MKGFKTILFNILLGAPVLLNLIMQLLQDPAIAPMIPASWMPYVSAALVIGNIILRFMTNSPVFTK